MGPPPPPKPIRIALLAHLSEVSGAGTALLEVARHLDRQKFDPVLVLPGRGPLLQRARDGGLNPMVVENTEAGFGGGSLFGKARLAAGRLSYILRLARFIRSRRVDLAYVNSATSIFAGVAARLAGVPIVWHVHETFDVPGRSTRAKMKVIERLSTGILYASKSAEAAFPAPRIRLRMVARNYLPVARIAAAEPMSASELQEFGIPAGARLILSNGMIRRKGADVLLEAFAHIARREVNPVRLVITGEPPPDSHDFAAELKFRAEELGLGEMVCFPGLVSELPRLIRRTDVFVSASRNEALPIAILEAQAAGVPVVATEVGDCRALLMEGHAGWLVPPDDSSALADALLQVLHAPDLSQTRAREAQRHLLKEYGGDGFWQPLEQFLKEAAGPAGFSCQAGYE